MLVRPDSPTSCREHASREATSCKEEVDIFQLNILRLGEEEVNNGDPEEIKYGEDDKYTPVDVFCLVSTRNYSIRANR